jgi:diguanylate cyclase (GGDEF)-like protein
MKIAFSFWFWCLLPMALFSVPTGGQARPIITGRPFCYAVTSLETVDQSGGGADVRCSGHPGGYQHQSLWLTMAGGKRGFGSDPAIQIHQSRFDRLAVRFVYADGLVDQQIVRRGDYGSHWRLGGQLIFEAPVRRVALQAITLRFDHLASYDLLRIRLVSADAAGVGGALGAAVIGGALTLLLLGMTYNLSLAIGLRRQFLAWHGLWAALMLVWGLIWSQAALALFPQMAGTLCSQVCTLLAGAAIAAATLCAVTGFERRHLPRWLQGGAIGLAALIGLVSIPASLLKDDRLPELGTLLSGLTLTDLVLVACCLGTAWRRGSPEARDLSISWAVPMLALAATNLIDIDDRLGGGGSQIAVLLASAFQTLWLAIATSRRLARLRTERDIARAAEVRLGELARRDHLTGLLNRRGFTDALDEMARGEREPEDGFGLLLLDVDHFKAINDGHGHDVGDAVLQRIGDQLRQWEDGTTVPARLGGEEFALAVPGLIGADLVAFADQVRGTVGHLAHPDLDAGHRVTVSIGAVWETDHISFEALYRRADEALYEAKRRGRDRVVAQRVQLMLASKPGSHPSDMMRKMQPSG